MNAAIDIGNTRIKIGLFNEGELIEAEVLPEESVQDYLVNNNVENLIISSVREGQPLHQELWTSSFNTLVFNHTTKLPFESLYATPTTLGLDRLAAAAGALTQFQGPILVIDAGSCITIDLIDEQNRFVGGVIFPGLEMQLKAMHTFTGKLPFLKPEEPQPGAGQSTEQAMLGGVVKGTRHVLEGFINEFKQQYPQIKVILTGGDGKYFDKPIEFNIFVLSNLVIEGLNTILRFNV